mmetsp:Transcript_39948/g.103375  ORF Transcript_39948/g.103375 Transcript_39948/m.103375 type:complete len:311 (+) Transcript_39948:1015-1947(+)
MLPSGSSSSSTSSRPVLTPSGRVATGVSTSVSGAFMGLRAGPSKGLVGSKGSSVAWPVPAWPSSIGTGAVVSSGAAVVVEGVNGTASVTSEAVVSVGRALEAGTDTASWSWSTSVDTGVAAGTAETVVPVVRADGADVVTAGSFGAAVVVSDSRVGSITGLTGSGCLASVGAGVVEGGGVVGSGVGISGSTSSIPPSSRIKLSIGPPYIAMLVASVPSSMASSRAAATAVASSMGAYTSSSMNAALASPCSRRRPPDMKLKGALGGGGGGLGGGGGEGGGEGAKGGLGAGVGAAVGIVVGAGVGADVGAT